MKRIPGFYKYCVSEDGCISRAGRALSPFCDKDGYLRVGITDDYGKRRSVGVHRAVALAYLGPPPASGYEVCHQDGSKDNNHWSNLRWDTRKGNHADLKVHGTSVIGERNGRAVLTAAAVSEIREKCVPPSGRVRVRKGVVSDLARKYGVNRNTIMRTASGKNWSEVE